jgi:hypothetical protein
MLRLAAILACLDWPAPWRTGTRPWDLCKIDCTNQHTRHISSHNLRMHPCAKLTNPYAADHSVPRAALQSNKVYPPRLCLLPLAGIVLRRINAIR